MTHSNFEMKDLYWVPVFDWNPCDLSRYLDIADKLISLFWNPGDLAGISNLRLKGIYSKLSGWAHDVFNPSDCKIRKQLKTYWRNILAKQKWDRINA